MATVEQKKKWLSEFYPLVQEICPQYGLVAIDAIVAQAACESNWGQSGLSVQAHNYWGMKCGSSYVGESINMATKEEYTVGTLTDIRANFRKYPDMRSGVIGYCEFITGYRRYANLINCDSNEQYIINIKNDGWATISTYITTVNTFMKYVREYMGTTQEENPYDEPTITVMRGTKGEAACWVQFELNQRGYDLAVDGNFGSLSEEALKDFQSKYFSDGKCGQLTRQALKAR